VLFYEFEKRNIMFQFPDRDNKLFTSAKTGSGAYPEGEWVISPAQNGRHVNLITNLHLAERNRTNGTRKYFFGTRHSLLSQIPFYFFHPTSVSVL
jgi:hypothetical protein